MNTPTPRKRSRQRLIPIIGIIGLILLLAACSTTLPTDLQPDLQPNPDIVSSNPQIDLDTIDYSEGFAINYANGLANGQNGITTLATQLLANSSFDTNTDWFNCGPDANSNLLTGVLTLSGDNACVYQALAATPGETYTLVCDGTSDAVYTSVTLSTLDVGWSPTDASTVVLDNASSVNTSLSAASDTTYVAVTLYSNGPATFETCTLTTDTSVTPVTPVAPVNPSTGDELLENPEFNSDTDWVNCADPNNETISNGTLTLSGNPACVFQTVPVITTDTGGTEYQLVCDSTSDAAWSNVSLSLLDSNFGILSNNIIPVGNQAAQPAVVTSLVSSQDTAFVSVTIYSEGPAVHENCSLIAVDSNNPTPPTNPTTPIGSDDNEVDLAVGNLLIDPSFEEDNSAWVNCAPANAKITGGDLYIEPDSCFFQDVDIDLANIAGSEIHLTCKGATSFPNSDTGVQGITEVAYSRFVLAALDGNGYYLDAQQGQDIATTSRQWRISWDASKLEPTTESLRVQFNGVSPSIYEYCYLTIGNAPTLLPEVINAPSKPLGLISTLYVDPADDAASWDELVSTAKASSDVEIMTVINPSNNDPFLAADHPARAVPLCDYGDYHPHMAELEAAGIKTLGYVPVGFVATRYKVEDVQANIDRYASCAGLDGIFFDEVQIWTVADAAYYKEICEYAVSQYPGGEFILNLGAHPNYIVEENTCNISLVFENNLNKWEEFFMYDYGVVASHPDSFVEMYDVSSTEIMEAGIDLAFSRNADYMYMTHRNDQNGLWGELFDKWAELLDYVAEQNRTIN